MKAYRMLMAAALVLGGCGGTLADDAEEIGHAAADVMASLDETGTGGGFAWNVVPLDRPGFDKTAVDRALDLVLPNAYAAACWTVTFSACDAGVRTKDFGDCALGLNKLSGSVTLTFSNQACTAAAVGDSITRAADFTLTGARNATLTVSAPGGGQKVTRTADGYLYTVLGMERIGKDGKGKTVFDIGTKTLEDLVVQGYFRKDRVVKSGKLEIEHKLAGYKTVFQPENVTWDGTCNCPVSGKLTGSVVGGKNDGKSASVTFTGCGTGDVTMNGEVTPTNFDRCAKL